jgi:hypothetical protein
LTPFKNDFLKGKKCELTKWPTTIDIREYNKTAHCHCPPALFWLSSYVASHCLSVAQQSGAKEKYYCTVYYIAVNSNCETLRAFKNLKKYCRR